ncbi:Thaumatin-like protein 1 [Apostasia shenzhenica]|uniref:Thaumatin-like protein 1 n=1 Tax=Apostasia shenzhenica TaxID=1088818 RepID=A0A2I0BF69_9ASPA|nr:Thaumatin-like protein 1 [Apostasia shenzhenica]
MAPLRSSPLLSLFAFLALLCPGAICVTFTITNNCGYTVWPGILSGAGTAALDTTGFALSAGQSRTLQIPSSWSGRLWGRTYCSTDRSTGSFSCATGDCGSGKQECSVGGASPPATLAELTLDGSGGMDFFDVSLVDGYNLPMLVVPQGKGIGSGNCTSTGCPVDLNGDCPSDLRVLLPDSGDGGASVACRSACEAFGRQEYCCSGEFGSPSTCKPSSFSQFFKKACPRAYSYAYDDATSTFTCPSGVNYLISFCPSTSRQMAGEDNPEAAGIPLINDTMSFFRPDTGGDGALARPAAGAAAAAAAAAAVVLLVSWPAMRLLLLF